MKFLYFGICFAVCICLDAKEVRQISRLIPLEDWIDFKNRTREVKPLDKFIGKLRATYDFVFHKADNVSNVGKILDDTRENLSEKMTIVNSTVSFIERRKSTSEMLEKMEMKEKENNNSSVNDNESMKKGIANDSLNEEFHVGHEKFDKIENLDDTLTLEHLEILDDEDSFDTHDREFDDSEKKTFPPHSSFALPYAIAQAIVRWLVSLYLSTSGNFPHTDTATRENV